MAKKLPSKKAKPSTRLAPSPRWSPRQVYAWASLFLLIILTVMLLTEKLLTQSPRNAAHPQRAHAPGVAFGLTPTHGVASIHLHNGTTLDVAKIEGSPTYQTFMLSNTSSDLTDPIFDTPLCNTLSSLHYALSSSTLLSFSVPDSCLTASTLAIKLLLHNLKLETEGVLGTNICFANILTHDPWRPVTPLIAMHALGLRPSDNLPQPAAPVHIRGNLPTPLPATKDKPWTVLAIEFSGRYVAGGLYSVRSPGALSPLRKPLSPNSISLAWDDAVSDVDRRSYHELKRTLEELLGLHESASESSYDPLPTDDLEELLAFSQNRSAPNPPPAIDQVILYGPEAENPDLRGLLEDMLGKDLVGAATVNTDPFTGTRLAAHKAHEWMDTDTWTQFEAQDRETFACRCRSELYATSWWDPLRAMWREGKQWVGSWASW